jgi:hypothetical protein
MANKLSHEDSRAIDMLLDGDRSNMTMVGSSNVKSGKMNMKNRIKAADRVLRLLSQMPSAEPSADLVKRTLQRVDETPVLTPTSVREAQRYDDVNNRPQA